MQQLDANTRPRYLVKPEYAEIAAKGAVIHTRVELDQQLWYPLEGIRVAFFYNVEISQMCNCRYAANHYL